MIRLLEDHCGYKVEWELELGGWGGEASTVIPIRDCGNLHYCSSSRAMEKTKKDKNYIKQGWSMSLDN